jgi:hypothetical protein
MAQLLFPVMSSLESVELTLPFFPMFFRLFVEMRQEGALFFQTPAQTLHGLRGHPMLEGVTTGFQFAWRTAIKKAALLRGFYHLVEESNPLSGP